MEMECIVVQVQPAVTGTSARGEWTKQEVIFEQPGDFGKKVCVSFWGDKAQDAAGLVPGEKVRVAANVESREYNGRWYTEVRAWKLERGASGGGHAAGAGTPTGNAPWGNQPASGGGAQPTGHTGGALAGAQAGAQAGAEYDWGTPSRPTPPLASTPEPSTKEDDFDDLPF